MPTIYTFHGNVAEVAPLADKVGRGGSDGSVAIGVEESSIVVLRSSGAHGDVAASLDPMNIPHYREGIGSRTDLYQPYGKQEPGFCTQPKNEKRLQTIRWSERTRYSRG
jgi:hypothetical protein